MSNPTLHTSQDLLRAVISRSGLSARRFAQQKLNVDERTVRYWLSGDREIPGPVLTICREIIAAPRIYRKLVAGGFVRYFGTPNDVAQTSWPDLFPDAPQPLLKPDPSGGHFIYIDAEERSLRMLTLGTPTRKDWRDLRAFDQAEVDRASE